MKIKKGGRKNGKKWRAAISGYSWEADDSKYGYVSYTDVRMDYADETVGFFDFEEEAEEALKAECQKRGIPY